MKVAIVLNTSWNIYNFRMGLIKALQSNGHQVVAIAPLDDYSTRIQEAKCEFHEVRMDSRGANVIKDFALILELSRIYKKVKPDVVLHYTIKPNIYGTIAARLNNIPAINNVCGLGTVFLKKSLITNVALALYKFAFRFPKRVFFQNQDDLDLFLSHKLIKKDLADIIPGSGVDLNKFQPKTFKRNKNFTFLLISRLIHDKGVVEYIDAIKKLKSNDIDARFQILGGLDEEHKRGIPKSLVDDWVKNNIIEYLGKTDDVISVINEADCVVLPSYREGTPKSLLEASSLSKPIVTTDVAGCRQVVENNHNGYLCEVKNSQDLADKMKKISSLDNITLERMGVNGRKKMEKEFDERLVINKYLTSLEELIR